MCKKHSKAYILPKWDTPKAFCGSMGSCQHDLSEAIGPIDNKGFDWPCSHQFYPKYYHWFQFYHCGHSGWKQKGEDIRVKQIKGRVKHSSESWPCLWVLHIPPITYEDFSRDCKFPQSRTVIYFLPPAVITREHCLKSNCRIFRTGVRAKSKTNSIPFNPSSHMAWTSLNFPAS